MKGQREVNDKRSELRIRAVLTLAFSCMLKLRRGQTPELTRLGNAAVIEFSSKTAQRTRVRPEKDMLMNPAKQKMFATWKMVAKWKMVEKWKVVAT